MKIIVAIANYGTKNDHYLAQLIREYKAMSHHVDIVVLSNVAKDLGPAVEVRVVTPPGKDPWSFPFRHKEIFAERVNDYDLFIYSEDDTLITERNIAAFLEVTDVLPANEIAGFLRFEKAADGTTSFSSVHGHRHWHPSSFRARGSHAFAFFSNEHSACYVLTRNQLDHAIKSGGFLVGPHQGPYDLLVTAATDPYTQCGFQKVICISNIEDFLVSHLPNKYVGQLGLGEAEFYQQIKALCEIGEGVRPSSVLFNTETGLFDGWWSKEYYETCDPALISLIPDYIKSVLSIGSGWGVTEEYLTQRGIRVVAVPIDPVIGACVEARGVRTIYGTLSEIPDKLEGETFDCILLPKMLHLVPEPVETLTTLLPLLVDGGLLVASVPNSSLRLRWRRLRQPQRLSRLGNFSQIRLHPTSPKTVRTWFRECGLALKTLTPVSLDSRQAQSFGYVNQILASDILAVGTK